MSSKDNPCHGCTAETGRTPTCKFDGSCNKYEAWNEEHTRIKGEMWRHKYSDSMANAYAKETHARLRKARKSKYD